MRSIKSLRKKSASVVRRGLVDRRGAAAVEFALVAPPFLALMMSTFEVGWFYFATSQVDAATLESARILRTGEVLRRNLSKEEFFAEVCPHLRVFGDCGALMTVEVTRYDTFAELAADTSQAVCANDEPAEIAALAYEPGTDNQVVRLRICMVYKTINPTIGVNVSDSDQGTRRLFSSYIVRVEPQTRNNRSSSSST